MALVVLLEGNVTVNQYKVLLTDHAYAMMKHFNSDGSGFFQDDNIAIHRAHFLTESLDESDGNLWISTNLLQISTFSSSIIKHISERTIFIHPVQFQSTDAKVF